MPSMASCPLKDHPGVMTPDPIDPLAAVAAAELGRTKLNESSLDETLNRVAAVARQALPGATDVSITLLRADTPRTVACTGELALSLDERQYEHRRGPCLQAAAEQTTISVPDTAGDTRWAGWAPLAARAGAGSVLSVGLPMRDDVRGALNIYGGRPAAFDENAVTLAQSFAGYAAVAVDNAYLYHHAAGLVRHLRAAMDSRAVIEQAKGVIMADRRCGADEAFALLTQLSQNTNRKLRDVAATVVTGVHGKP
jgi:GAF domain-containing protein